MVHADSDAAASFYVKLDPTFAELPGHRRHLVLLMKDLRKAIRRSTLMNDRSG